MTQIEVHRAVQLYARAFAHVEETGHTKLVCADNPPGLGIACAECETWWACPLPRPGQFDHWPHHLLEGKRFDHSANGRREYLAYGIAESLKKRAPTPVVGPSAWDWIRRRDGVGW